MPELPEVETVRRGLVPALEGKRIARVLQRRAGLRYLLPERFVERLTGRRIERLDRRAKYLLLHLDNGEVLLSHLGMSGRFTVMAPSGVVRPGRFHHPMPHGGPGGEEGLGLHDHIVFDMEDGGRVIYADHRRFGFMDLIAPDGAGDEPGSGLRANRHLAALGPEPLGNDFSAPVLSARLKGRATSIKAALLDQRTVSGLGNIYVCEALFRAGISPLRTASSVAGPVRTERLVRAIRDVLTDAIMAGGSTLRDYARTDGELGYFQHQFQVYGREGEACSRPGCGGRVVRIVQSNRSTFYCPGCQR
ncbi:MAG: bifunctional DNA-formamidopyrimidine glycosylase/DNA-(apurinic or apyrimidinic site) lyase [Parvibaculaceae bacterium]|nr:bifunctional DNA-formamidopyrimidine glycosylase/DNA-(apurinic or apyrimidinic site) lyase [Parvibaculaceae bacterium]